MRACACMPAHMRACMRIDFDRSRHLMHKPTQHRCVHACLRVSVHVLAHVPARISARANVRVCTIGPLIGVSGGHCMLFVLPYRPFFETQPPSRLSCTFLLWLLRKARGHKGSERSGAGGGSEGEREGVSSIDGTLCSIELQLYESVATPRGLNLHACSNVRPFNDIANHFVKPFPPCGGPMILSRIVSATRCETSLISSEC